MPGAAGQGRDFRVFDRGRFHQLRYSFIRAVREWAADAEVAPKGGTLPGAGALPAPDEIEPTRAFFPESAGTAAGRPGMGGVAFSGWFDGDRVSGRIG